MMYDQRTRDVFHQGRNLYLSLLGLVLWALAWRLKVLHDAQQLRAPQAHHGGPGRRWLWMVVGFLALLAADIPLCRINYTLQLNSVVTPRKTSLLAAAAECKGVMESES